MKHIKKAELSISQIQTIIFLLRKQIAETEIHLQEHTDDEYMAAMLKEYKDSIVKFYYISTAQFGVQLVEDEKSQNIVKKDIEAGELTESERIAENNEYFQYLQKLHGA